MRDEDGETASGCCIARRCWEEVTVCIVGKVLTNLYFFTVFHEELSVNVLKTEF